MRTRRKDRTRVRQFSQGSIDGGKSWHVEYKLTSFRKKLERPRAGHCSHRSKLYLEEAACAALGRTEISTLEG